MLSQSARLVREQIRLQAEFGPLLLLGLDDAQHRADAAAHDRRIVRAVAAHRPAKAREAAGDLLSGLHRAAPRREGRIEREVC